MVKILEKTEKFYITEESEVDEIIEEYKEHKDGLLIDHKVSYKETKDNIYYIVTLKMRYLTLAEAKEA